MSEKMKLKLVAQFAIHYLQYLDASHQPTQSFPAFATPETLIELYKAMAFTRALDHRAVNLQRTGKMGTYPSSLGQEAVGVGVGHAMKKDDIFCPYYRDQGTFLQRGIKASEILRYWGGDERGSNFSESREDLPNCVPIATQCLHAAGVAFALKYRHEKRAVVTMIGEGGTSKGDFYEAMNLSGEWNLPIVFVVNNNQWAISVPRAKQTAAQTIAQKAIAAGFDGVQVDGNDVIAVRQAVTEALEKARDGRGPTLIEAITYRLCDHTTADDMTRYSKEEDRKAAWLLEPVARLGYYLEAQQLWSKEKEAELQKELRAHLEKEVDDYLNMPPQKMTDLIDYLYAEVPEALLDQRDALGEKK
jgi:2-oxoisovalerate dehydrogenase E1 component alpha subunit